MISCGSRTVYRMIEQVVSGTKSKKCLLPGEKMLAIQRRPLHGSPPVHPLSRSLQFPHQCRSTMSTPPISCVHERTRRISIHAQVGRDPSSRASKRSRWYPTLPYLTLCSLVASSPLHRKSNELARSIFPSIPRPIGVTLLPPLFSLIFWSIFSVSVETRYVCFSWSRLIALGVAVFFVLVVREPRSRIS